MHALIRIFLLLSVVLVCYTGDCDAQLLKKLSKGLEKVNKGIESVDKAVKGNKRNNSQQNASTSVANESQTEYETSALNSYEEDSETASAQGDDQLDLITKGSVYPHVTSNTKILYQPPITNLDGLKTVGEGVFATTENGKIGFWTMDGRRLTDCRFDDPGINSYPRFDNGAAMVSENGQFVILYKDGTARKLPKTFNEASQFQDGVAVINEGLGKFFIIDTKDTI